MRRCVARTRTLRAQVTGFMPSTRPADLINSFSAGVLISAILAE